MVRKVRLRNGAKTYVETYEGHSFYAWVECKPSLRGRMFTADGHYLANGEVDDYDIVAWDIDGEAPAPESAPDTVNHPNHYTSHPSGVECITLTEHMPFNVGNVVKYLWRAGLKDNAPSHEDYNKAAWYLLREFKRLGVKLTVSPEVIEGLR